MYPKCILPGFTNQIHNVSLVRPIGPIHAGYILNVPHLSNVIGLGSKCVRSMKLGTLRSHDWVHSKSDQHVSQEQIKITLMGTFPMYPLFAHWAHWGYLLSVPAMCSACAQQVNDPLSPVTMTLPSLQAVATEDMGMETQAAEATMEVLEVTMEITMEG